MAVPANQPVLRLEHTRLSGLRSCESCSVKTAKHRLDMPGGPTYELCEICVEAFRL